MVNGVSYFSARLQRSLKRILGRLGENKNESRLMCCRLTCQFYFVKRIMGRILRALKLEKGINYIQRSHL